MPGRLLPIYLNDHLVGVTAAIELAKRVSRSNDGTPLGAYAAALAAEAVAERAALRDVMKQADAAEDPLKRAAGFVGEKVGRLKLNGRLRGYSPLSRLLEIEALIALATMSAALWRSLQETGRADGEWVQRAERRLEALEEHRARAAAEALAED